MKILRSLLIVAAIALGLSAVSSANASPIVVVHVVRYIPYVAPSRPLSLFPLSTNYAPVCYPVQRPVCPIVIRRR